MTECAIMDDPFITEVGNEPHMLLKLLKFTGWWLSLEDWRKIETLNKGIYAWYHSEDATMSGRPWQERTLNLFEIIQDVHYQLYRDYFRHDLCIMDWQPPDTIVDIFFGKNRIPFLGKRVNSVLFPKCKKYRNEVLWSSFELFTLEQKILGSALHDEGDCVRSGPLTISGSDQWLVVNLNSESYINLSRYNCANLNRYNCDEKYCIRLCHYLKSDVPKGLKFFLNLSHYAHIPGPLRNWEVETLESIGRAASLKLGGLVVRGNAKSMETLLVAFLSGLEDLHHKPQFTPPIEILSFHPTDSQPYDGIIDVMCKMRDEFDSHVYKNMKYLHLGFVDYFWQAVEVGVFDLPFSLPKLQLLELGEQNCHFEWPSNFQWPDRFHGLNNLVLIEDIHPFLGWETLPNVTGVEFGTCMKKKKNVVASVKNGFLPFLKVLVCHGPIRQPGLSDALAIGCPELRFLEIDMCDVCTDGDVDCSPDLLKRLFVLIVECGENHGISKVTNFFPEGCELRVLTIVYYEECFDIRSCVVEVLNIKDTCLPKLKKLNIVVTCKYISRPDCCYWADEMRSYLRRKSIDLSCIVSPSCVSPEFYLL